MRQNRRFGDYYIVGLSHNQKYFYKKYFRNQPATGGERPPTRKWKLDQNPQMTSCLKDILINFCPGVGIMSDFELDKSALKKLVNIARTKPLAFAFCPSAGEEDPVFFIHRRKKPDVLGKGLRKESGQPKVSFGTVSVNGKVMNLTCDRVIPGMSKKLKKLLRDQKVPMDVMLLDAKGKELGG
ncbi:MAG: hypothetical protein ACJASV_000540 [Pseudorhodobacter sp.]|jgi:hypothetical protein